MNGDILFLSNQTLENIFLVLCLPVAQQVYCSSVGGALEIVTRSFLDYKIVIVVGQELGDPLD